MKGLKKQRRIQIIVITFLALAGSVALMGWAFKDGINLFRSPSQVLAEIPLETEVFRIGGLVVEGSIVRGQGEEISFSVTDGEAIVPVTYTGILPDLFAEGQGMVGAGRYINGVFQATEILAKHDENYLPKEIIDTLKDQGTYQAPEGS